MSSPVAFVIGAGPNVGAGIVEGLAAQGYTVVAGSRSARLVPGAKTAVKLDSTNHESIVAAFAEVTSTVGPPSVIVFNSYGMTMPSGDITSVPLEDFAHDVAYGTIGLYAAAQCAVAAFRAAPAGTPKVFIYTGNISPFVPADERLAPYITLAVSKTAAARQIEFFANAFAKEGFRFYFPSQINRVGGPVLNEQLVGSAHARAFQALIERTEQGEWDVRFYEDGSEGPQEPVSMTILQ